MKIIIFFMTIFLLVSCNKTNEDFNVVSCSNSFEFKDEVVLGGRLEKMLANNSIESNYKSKKINDAYYLNLNVDIVNRTGEKIEYANISPVISIKYNNSYQSISAGDFEFVTSEFEQYWNADETKNINYKFLLNEQPSFNSEYFNHKPENVELILYLKAKNSIGFNNIVGNGGAEILRKDISDTWNF
ncbi:MAG: hypothetical protein Q8O62_08110 [Aequorivita sp.]|nr:hypothetical protein [Aequorivita sp.]